MALEAQGDTWGIPGPTFLLLYVAAMVAVAIIAVVHRRILFAGPRDAIVSTLGPQQIAYLNGGDKLAVYASLAGLRAAGAIRSSAGRNLAQSGPMPAGVTPLDTAVYNAAGRRIRAREVFTDAWVRSALGQLRDGLEQSGLAVSAAKARAARSWMFAGLALILLGAARLYAGFAGDKPIGFLVVALIPAVILTIALGRVTRRRTYGASKAMGELRRRHDHLSPRQSPSYATYGAAGAAMGVALFGAATLYTMDPAFAAEAEIQRAAASGGTSGWTSTSSCGSSSSSSCGGGSSSCGGGGGGCGG
ncbi:TIGR04222 domain-containing membrane protein [Couchioplanes caeruleus]|uniref:TIGR04222 domain-containing membrane protein n=2 Tax=Couchioplanes caeruleus TaxID=56438 RepID=A0A1K0G493_9ACTN|nr:TIGR04222 domain-containing membrane protein [Couchioplanes caeruleus]OJF12106.1 hypothetical protein BG844_22455 [Couchioplanes caeruleus subsp. caeruleus]ROP29061.1 uncharacterized protein (TIGR04222 family) [Couchioplanes caeruleus]